MWSHFGFNLAVMHIMPPFVPNQYMLDKHSDKGEYDWEIYAWCVRDAMCKAGGFSKSEQSYRDKLQYENFMQKKKEEITYEGKTWSP